MDRSPLTSPQRDTFNNSGVVSNGMDVPFFREGAAGPQILSAADMNRLVSILRSVVNPRIVQGETWGIRFTDTGWTLQVGAPPLSGSSGGGGGGGIPFQLKSVQGDYVTAWGWNGSAFASPDIYLAKEYKLRNSLTAETIFGVAHAYSYASGPDSDNVYRTNSDGTNSQTEIVSPPWVAGEIVYASNCNTLVLDGGGNPITWLMERTCLWAKPSPLSVTPSTPANSSATTSGYTSGLIVADANYIYVSVGANSWKRLSAALVTF